MTTATITDASCAQVTTLRQAAKADAENIYDSAITLISTAPVLRRATVRNLLALGVREDVAEAAGKNLALAMQYAASALKNASQEVEAITDAVDNVTDTANEARPGTF